MVVDFKNIIDGFTENGYVSIKNLLSDYISCFYINCDDLDRSMMTEKVCDYVMAFESKNNKRDSSLPDLYVNEFLPIINKIVKTPKKDESPSQAYRYVLRYQEIAERIKKGKSENIIEDLEDITKIFLCLYNVYLKNNHEKVENIEFKIRGVGFDYIRTDLTKSKRLSLTRSKNNAEDEIVYNTLSANNKSNIYSIRNFVVMMLSVFYVRLMDLEAE